MIASDLRGRKPKVGTSRHFARALALFWARLSPIERYAIDVQRPRGVLPERIAARLVVVVDFGAE